MLVDNKKISFTYSFVENEPIFKFNLHDLKKKVLKTRCKMYL